MKRILYLCIAFTVLLEGNCMAVNRLIKGVETEDVTESLEKGGAVLTCQKSNKITLYNTTGKIDRFCSFFQRVTNQSQEPIAFTPRIIRITDNEGNSLPLVPKYEVLTRIKQKNSRKQMELDCWYMREKKRLTSELEDLLAEKILFERGEFPTRNRMREDKTGLRKVVPGDRDFEKDLRREEEGRRAAMKEEIRMLLKREREVREALQELPATYEHERADLLEKNRIEVENVHHNYLDNYTIMPGETYEKNFQVKVPLHRLKDLQNIKITYQLDGELYTFTYKIDQRIKQRTRKVR